MGRAPRKVSFTVTNDVTSFLAARTRRVPIRKYKDAINRSTRTIIKIAKIKIPVWTGAAKKDLRQVKAVEIAMGIMFGHVEIDNPHAIYFHEGTGVYAGRSGWRPPPFIPKSKKEVSRHKATLAKHGIKREMTPGKPFAYYWTEGQKGKPFLTTSMRQAWGAIDSVMTYTLASKMWQRRGEAKKVT